MSIRYIHLPAIDRTVTLGEYVRGVKLAKANPRHQFKHGLASWWPTYGADIVHQFRQGIHQRINEAISYSERGSTAP